jgi:tRNA pseudouridine55 synthase
MNGVVLIDKPAGVTSHDVVNRWRKLAGTKRVGHLGTLDPMATGLLVLVTGPVTRLAQFYGQEEKTYEAEITFGVTSDTYDADGLVEKTGSPVPSQDAIAAGLESFRGRFLQTPPAVSAKKLSGVPAYKLARKQMPVELDPVPVEVKQLDVMNVAEDKLWIRLACSAGTYVRSIAHDLGQKLGCGALLSALRRTHAGQFRVERAHTLCELQIMAQEGRLAEAVIPGANLLPEIPAEHVDILTEAQIRQGRHFRTSPFTVPPGSPLVRVLSRSGDLIAIGQMVLPNLYHPTTVLSSEG